MAANRERGEVEISIDGADRILRFDFNALAKLEHRLGMSIAKIFEGDKIGLTTIRECLFVGIRWGKSISSEEVGSMLKLSEVQIYAAKIAEAVALATGGESKSADPEVAPAEATGA